MVNFIPKDDIFRSHSTVFAPHKVVVILIIISIEEEGKIIDSYSFLFRSGWRADTMILRLRRKEKEEMME